MTRKWTRRDFLKFAGAAVIVTASCGGLTQLAALAPDVDLPEKTYRGKMNQKILVVYATKAGSTAEIADGIGQKLAESGVSVDVSPVEAAKDLHDYRAVVLGSAVRMGRWLPGMMTWIESNRAALQSMPVAVFSVHLLNLGEDETSRAAREAYTAPLHQLISPCAETFFAGKMDLSKLSFFDRTLSKMMKAQDSDLRDWNAVHTWAGGLPAVLYV
jgi:menaquinone-dependent protoporphyrinogen oxidase